MVSLQPSISTKERSTDWFTIFEEKSKKRKLEEDNDDIGEVERGGKELNLWWCAKPTTTSSTTVCAATVVDDIELGDSPLPPEWQRCLDIKSGRIHFYNTRTNRRTTKDPRCVEVMTTPPPAPTSRADHVTIDLELNLGFESPNKVDRSQEQREELKEEGRGVDDGGHKTYYKKQRLDVAGSLKPATSEEVEHREMVAAVCIRCHMLVMMCKSSPSCPNCKYLHHHESTTSPERRSSLI